MPSGVIISGEAGARHGHKSSVPEDLWPGAAIVGGCESGGVPAGQETATADTATVRRLEAILASND